MPFTFLYQCSLCYFWVWSNTAWAGKDHTHLSKSMACCKAMVLPGYSDFFRIGQLQDRHCLGLIYCRNLTLKWSLKSPFSNRLHGEPKCMSEWFVKLQSAFEIWKYSEFKDYFFLNQIGWMFELSWRIGEAECQLLCSFHPLSSSFSWYKTFQEPRKCADD